MRWSNAGHFPARRATLQASSASSMWNGQVRSFCLRYVPLVVFPTFSAVVHVPKRDRLQRRHRLVEYCTRDKHVATNTSGCPQRRFRHSSLPRPFWTSTSTRPVPTASAIGCGSTTSSSSSRFRFWCARTAAPPSDSVVAPKLCFVESNGMVPSGRRCLDWVRAV